MEASKSYIRDNIRLQRLVLVVGILLLAAKFVAYFLTHSNAILTDAVESITNVVAAAFALYSLHLSSLPKDQNHPYGHGKIEFLSATLEGAMILIAGLLIVGKSVYNLFVPQEIHQLDMGILLIAGSGLINFFIGLVTSRNGKKKQNLVLHAGGKHLLADAYSSAGLVAGLIIISLTGLVWLDSVVALVFGGIISITGARILRFSVAGIMDEADYELLQQIVEVLNKNRRPNWIDIHNLRVIKYGSTLHIDCHLTVPWYLNVKDAHSEVKAVEELVNTHFDSNIELFIHVDPCIPPSCKICEKLVCEHREHPFEQRLEWKFENVIGNKKHGV